MPAPVQPDFAYEKLADPAKEFRLLRLEETDVDGHFVFALEKFPLDTQQRYVALSYEWGQPGNERTIIVNRKRFLIQSNLDLFLRRIYAYEKRNLPCYLWNDAVCIDQHDDQGVDAEKSHQVRMMTRIFSQATMVYAWLGDSTTAGIACDFLERWAKDDTVVEAVEERKTTQFVSWQTDRLEIDFTSKILSLPDPARISEWSPSQRVRELWSAIGILGQRSYWTRLWIYQEIALASSLRIFYGQRILGHEAMEILHLLGGGLSLIVSGDAYKAHAGLCSDLAELSRFLGRFCGLGSFGSPYGWPIPASGNSLSNLITGLGQGLECEKFQDKVYGLLGLCNDVHLQRLYEIDYAISGEGLLAQTLALCPFDYDDTVSLGISLMKAMSLCPRKGDDVITWAFSFVANCNQTASRWLSTHRKLELRAVVGLPAAYQVLPLASDCTDDASFGKRLAVLYEHESLRKDWHLVEMRKPAGCSHLIEVSAFKLTQGRDMDTIAVLVDCRQGDCTLSQLTSSQDNTEHLVQYGAVICGIAINVPKNNESSFLEGLRPWVMSNRNSIDSLAPLRRHSYGDRGYRYLAVEVSIKEILNVLVLFNLLLFAG